MERRKYSWRLRDPEYKKASSKIIVFTQDRRISRAPWHTTGGKKVPPLKRWKEGVEDRSDPRGCWYWNKGTNAEGHPVFTVDGKVVRADVWAWKRHAKRFRPHALESAEEYGKGWEKTCGEKLCVNWRHLDWVPRKPPRRGTGRPRGRPRKYPVPLPQPKGDRARHMSHESIRDIRNRYWEGQRVATIVRDYPFLSWNAVKDIAVGRSYADVR